MPAKLWGGQQNFNKIPILGMVPESSSTAPSNPVAGQLWLDTSLTPSRLKIFENGAWELASNSGVELQANKGAANGYAPLNGSSQVPLANLAVAASGTSSATALVRADDSRLADSRTPSGNAGGDLTGTYPNPTVAGGAITDAKVAAANKDGAAGTASMRTLGTGAQQALAGNTRLDQLGAPTAAVPMNGQKITTLADPTADTDAANKRYVDLARQGIRQKDAVRVATTGNITLSGTQTIDTVAVAAGNRVLVKNQTAAQDNGIYIVAAGAWTRATDADTAAEVGDGVTVWVSEGGQANTTWSQINTITTLGTDVQNWIQQGAAVNYIAGNGLALTGSTFDVNVDGVGIEINADILRLKDLGVTTGKLADNAVTLTSGAGQKVTGTLPVANGGTGATTAAGARTNLAAVGKHSQDLAALTAGVELVITHNLNTLDVHAAFRTVADGYDVVMNWRVISVNTIGVTADVAFAASALRVVVMG